MHPVRVDTESLGDGRADIIGRIFLHGLRRAAVSCQEFGSGAVAFDGGLNVMDGLDVVKVREEVGWNTL